MSHIWDEIEKKADEFSEQAVKEYREEDYDDDYGEYDHQVSEEFAQEIVDDLSDAELVEIAADSDDKRFNDAIYLFGVGEASHGYLPIHDYLRSLAWCVAYSIVDGKVRTALEDGDFEDEDDE